MTSGGKRVFSHDEAFPELGALALGALSAGESDGVGAHVAHCAICTAELAVMYDTAGSLASAVSDSEKPLDSARSARMRTELLARARLDAAARASNLSVSEGVESRPLSRRDATLPITVERRVYLAPILGTALAASIVFGFIVLQQTRKSNALLQVNAQLFARIDSLETEVGEAGRMIASLAGREVKVVDLVASGVTPPRARMFWDIATDKWTMFAHDLPALPAGRTYQLWLVTSTGPKDAGTFTPSATGMGIVERTFQLSPTDLQAIAITEEPAGGSPQPTSTPILVGSAK